MTYEQEYADAKVIMTALREDTGKRYSEVKVITKWWSEYSTELYCTGYIGVTTVSILGFIDWLIRTERISNG